MTSSERFDQLRDQAMQLPTRERLELAQALQDSVDDSGDDLHPAWRAELERRVAEVDAGAADGVPIEEAFADIRARLGW